MCNRTECIFAAVLLHKMCSGRPLWFTACFIKIMSHLQPSHVKSTTMHCSLRPCISVCFFSKTPSSSSAALHYHVTSHNATQFSDWDGGSQAALCFVLHNRSTFSHVALSSFPFFLRILSFSPVRHTIPDVGSSHVCLSELSLIQNQANRKLHLVCNFSFALVLRLRFSIIIILIIY